MSEIIAAIVALLHHTEAMIVITNLILVVVTLHAIPQAERRHAVRHVFARATERVRFRRNGEVRSVTERVEVDEDEPHGHA